jgi:hypothetical protein
MLPAGTRKAVNAPLAEGGPPYTRPGILDKIGGSLKSQACRSEWMESDVCPAAVEGRCPPGSMASDQLADHRGRSGGLCPSGGGQSRIPGTPGGAATRPPTARPQYAGHGARACGPQRIAENRAPSHHLQTDVARLEPQGPVRLYVAARRGVAPGRQHVVSLDLRQRRLREDRQPEVPSLVHFLWPLRRNRPPAIHCQSGARGQRRHQRRSWHVPGPVLRE